MAPEAGQGTALLQAMARRFPRTPIIYCCACPAETARGVVRDLTPVVLLGGGAGVLVSRRTRWRGVVNALDFAPTLLQLTGIPAADDSLRNPLSVLPCAAPAQRVRRIAAQARAAYPAILTLDLLYFILMGLLLFPPVLNRGVRSPQLRALLPASWLVPLLLVFLLPRVWFLPLGVKIALMLLGWLLLSLPFRRLPPLTGWAWATTLGSAGLLLNVFFPPPLPRSPISAISS